MSDVGTPSEKSTDERREALPGLAVVVPARNEQERLPRCLRALGAAEALLHRQLPGAPRTRIVVVLDSCTDRSRAVVDRWRGVEVLTREFGNVGAARAAGAQYALGGPADARPEWLACTDADSAVPTEWLLQHMEHARADTDLLLGVVRPDAEELQPSSMNRWMTQYHLRDGHPHVHGANMGVRADMYLRAGGFPLLAEHEDVALAQRIRALGGRVVSTAGHPVLTSGRLAGRTPGGMAGYLTALAQHAIVTDRSFKLRVDSVARPKSFSTEQLLPLALACFTAGGYEGTSIDDLVQALHVHRGSLYKEFGSKRGLFLAVLQDYVRSTLPLAIAAAVSAPGDAFDTLTAGSELDLLLIAGIERGHTDPQVAALVGEALRQLDGIAGSAPALAMLGARLGRRLLPTGRHQSDTTVEEGI